MNSSDSSETTEVVSSHAYREWPLVSVIVVTYKRAGKLRRALDSVLAQTFTDMEVWCVHDGPADDDTIAVYEEYDKKFDEVGIDFFPIATDLHSGYYCQPRNVATENCRGTYVANLDDDNEWLPNALEVLVTAIREGEMWPDLVYGRRHYVLEEGAPRSFNGVELTEGDSPYIPWSEEAKVSLAIGPQYNFIDSSDFLVSKGALYRLATTTNMIWNERRRRFGDWELVARAAYFSDMRFKGVDAIVQRYYIHGDNVSLTRPAHETTKVKSIYDNA